MGARRQKKIFRVCVEIECGEVDGWRSFNGQFLSGGDFCVKLLSDFLCDLTLDSEHVPQIAIVLFSPDVGVCARVDQLGVYVNPVSRYSDFQTEALRSQLLSGAGPARFSKSSHPQSLPVRPRTPLKAPQLDFVAAICYRG